MSTASNYVQFILDKHFGPTASAVTRLMRIKGPVMMLEILRDCGNLCAVHVGRCLRSLLRHGVVRVRQRKPLKYELIYSSAFQIPRFPLFCQLVLHFYGKVAEDIITYLFLVGQATVSDLLRICISSDKSASSDEERHKFVEVLGGSFDTLIKTNVLKVSMPVSESPDCNPPSEDNPTPETNRNVKEWPFQRDTLCDAMHKFVSTGNVRSLKEAADSEPERKRARGTSSEENAWKYVVSPNIATLEAMWRDRLIVQLAIERLGETCGDILSHLLCIATAAYRGTEITSPESGGVSRSELIRSLRKEPDFFDSHLSLLVEDEMGFLIHEGGLSGYMYTCPYKRVIKQMLAKHAEHVVQVLFQISGLRIFRLLLCYGPLTHEEVERRVLLPQSDFRRTLPKMIAAGFISTTELSRTKEYTADTILCLYSVNLSRVAALLIEWAQHAAWRVGLRAAYEFELKKRLIYHRYRVETLIKKHQAKLAQLKDTDETVMKPQIDESETNKEQRSHHQESLDALVSSITPSEQQQLRALTNKLAKLTVCEEDAHITWFVADVYLRLNT
ncbi:unnamed protein product [Calicophoron daubneyi]|uniref:DNA-directed RNA polymerase III subunit RPC3 n=1 Tax=Calicophoron daubneyi TaxID=300641 RepID=A0AAV2TJA4_CALDB